VSVRQLNKVFVKFQGCSTGNVITFVTPFNLFQLLSKRNRRFVVCSQILFKFLLVPKDQNQEVSESQKNNTFSRGSS